MTSPPYTIDPLTGIGDRAALDAQLTLLVATALRDQLSVSLMVVDLDFFKSINDAFGHTRGDHVLTEFAQRARVAIRASDLVFRYGGDEFVVLLPGATREQSEQVAQRLLNAICTTPFAGDPPLSLTVSIGIARYPDDALSADQLFAIADRRSFQAKRWGRSRFFSSDIKTNNLIDPPARLIERDSELEQLALFLDQIADRQRSLLQIGGPRGSGRSRMLDEAVQAAQMRHVPVLVLRGTPALRTRVYGAFANIERWPDLPPPSLNPAVFAEALQRTIERRGARSILIALDHIEDLDRSSLELIRALAEQPALQHLAIIVTTAGRLQGEYGFYRDRTLTEQMILGPLSDEGLRAWLRHSLHWEPSAEFLGWFADVTGRLPGLITTALERLIAEQALVPAEGGWVYHPDPAHIATEALILRAPEPARSLPLIGEFVGRNDELRRLVDALHHQRVVLLYGPGGIGKSRLAAQAAAESAVHFPGGVWWVGLVGLTSSRQIIPAIATALELEVGYVDHPLERVALTMRDRRTLLVLDNLDQLADSAAIIETLLERIPSLSLLITTTLLPSLPNALVFPVRGLATPADDQSATAESSEAVQLFLARAQRADPTFQLNDSTRPAVVRICRLVEGMPLGIELAAVQISYATCQEIADDLTTNLLALRLPSEHGQLAGLTAVIERFWSLLGWHEQSTLARLGIFRSGFRGDAAGRIAEASSFFLNALTASGYLHRESDGRYALHELLRQYALQQLAYNPSLHQQTSQQHCRYYSDFAAQRVDELLATRVAHDEIQSEFDNLRAAWEWAIATQAAPQLSAASLALLRYSVAAGLLAEFMAMLEDAVQALDQPELSAATTRALAHLEGHRANVLYNFSRFSEAIATAEHAQTLAQAGDDLGAEAYALFVLGNALLVQSEFSRAHGLLTQALALARAAGLRWHEASILTARAYAANSLRRYSEVRTALRQALTIFREIGAMRDEATALNALGNIAEDRGDPTAQEWYEQALRLYRRLGDRDGESGVLHNLGVVAILLGQYDAARVALEEALRGFHKLGSRFGQAITNYNLGRMNRALTRWGDAEQHFTIALDLARAIGNREIEVAILNGLAQTYALQDRRSAARKSYVQAVQLARQLGDKRNQSRILAGIAHVELQRGRARAGLRAAQHALRLAEAIDHPLFQSDALAALSASYMALGDREQAEIASQRASTILSDLGLNPAPTLR